MLLFILNNLLRIHDYGPKIITSPVKQTPAASWPPNIEHLEGVVRVIAEIANLAKTTKQTELT